MTLTNIFSPKSAFSYLGVGLAWVIVWFCLGVTDLFFAIVGFVVLIVVIWGVYAFVKTRNKSVLFITEEEAVHVISYAFALTAIFAVLWPHILFHNYFLPTYVVLWLYFIPVITVCFSALYLFHHLFQKVPVSVIHAFLFGLTFAVVLTVIASFIMHVQINRMQTYVAMSEDDVKQYFAPNVAPTGIEIIRLAGYEWRVNYHILKSDFAVQHLDPSSSNAEKLIVSITKTRIAKAHYTSLVTDYQLLQSPEFNESHPDRQAYYERLQSYVAAESNVFRDEKPADLFNEIMQLQTPSEFHRFQKQYLPNSMALGESGTMIWFYSKSPWSVLGGLDYALAHTTFVKEEYVHSLRAVVLLNQVKSNAPMHVWVTQQDTALWGETDWLLVNRAIANEICDLKNDSYCAIVR